MNGWHFLPKDRKLRYGSNTLVEAGKTYSAEGPLKICNNGMHASRSLLQALEYAPGPIICRVDVQGEIIKQDDKICGRHRTVEWIIDGEMLLHDAACRFAEDALTTAGVTDARCWDAIRVKRLWTAGEASDAELDFARVAANAAYVNANANADAHAAAAICANANAAYANAICANAYANATYAANAKADAHACACANAAKAAYANANADAKAAADLAADANAYAKADANASRKKNNAILTGLVMAEYRRGRA